VARRSPRIDALRGLAVFGILLINAWGFVYGYALHHYPALDGPMGAADQWVVFLVSAFAEQKFYPIFAFLFGAGFALQTGRCQAEGPALAAIRATYLRRVRWLLVCGILHGVLLWFGDILTAYAILGFWLVQYAGRRLSALLPALWVLITANVLIFLYYGVLVAAAATLPLDQCVSEIVEGERMHALYTLGGWVEVGRARLSEYGDNLLGFVVFLPRLALLFLLGVFATRMGCLIRPERHRALWRKVAWVTLVAALPLNLWAGLVAVARVADPFTAPPGAGLANALLELAGPVMGAGYVALFMLAGPRFCAWLVPVGRMALTNYLMQSALLMLTLQGVGLGLGADISHTGLMLLAAAIMAGQLAWSHWWMARHAMGPVEALWRRYTHSAASV
jgi:uncharacterized protein